jgi:uncharacterized protein (DUF2147 family)
MMRPSTLAAAALAFAIGAAPTLSAAADPTGTWISAGGESKFTVSYCGSGKELCAKLTWLSPEAKTEENLPYLNKYVVQGALPASENQWKGTVNYGGDTFKGSLTMVSADALKVKGCKGMFCQSMSLVRS